MDLWNVNNDTIGQVAVRKIAGELSIDLANLTPMGVRRLSGLYVDVEVVERVSGKRHGVTVYETDLLDERLIRDIEGLH